MLQYGFIKYILGYNMCTFEFPTTEILVSTCVLNYKTYYQCVVIKTVWQQYQTRQAKQWERCSDKHKYKNLVHNKRCLK